MLYEVITTIIIITSNVGTDTTMRLFEDESTSPSPNGLAKALKPDLLQVFKPAFLGRINVIPYLPLADEQLKQIICLQLKRVTRRLLNNYKVEFNYDEDVVNYIVSQCQDADSGARTIHNVIQNRILPEMSVKILQFVAESKALSNIRLMVDGNEFKYDIL